MWSIAWFLSTLLKTALDAKEKYVICKVIQLIIELNEWLSFFLSQWNDEMKSLGLLLRLVFIHFVNIV